ncbi:MAG TPA: hypothetical protein VFH68_19755 [Polyangia bacterium]|nr:hypothetical protein [Polyangia bacterium]
MGVQARRCSHDTLPAHAGRRAAGRRRQRPNIAACRLTTFLERATGGGQQRQHAAHGQGDPARTLRPVAGVDSGATHRPRARQNADAA